jgi:alanine racemase
MGRTGIYLKDIDEFIKCIKQYKNINVEGVYTHLSSADSDEAFTKEQLGKFEEGVLKIKEEFSNLKYIHSSASNGLLNFKCEICNLVRPGIILYGYQSSYSTLEKIDLKPVAKLKSKISFIKDVEEGCSISYGRTFIADRKIKVATIALGYADGVRRSLSNKGYVVINGKKAPIIGTVCMDSFMVDVTELPDAKLGSEVYIWDNEIITLEDIAKWCDTINYEILSTISDRVPRVFK